MIYGSDRGVEGIYPLTNSFAAITNVHFQSSYMYVGDDHAHSGKLGSLYDLIESISG